jgi:hypothetical protein
VSDRGVCSSWGEFWGEMGYIRVEKGNNALRLETQCSWAVPDQFTEGSGAASTNVRCFEDGTNCGSKVNPMPAGACMLFCMCPPCVLFCMPSLVVLLEPDGHQTTHSSSKQPILTVHRPPSLCVVRRALPLAHLLALAHPLLPAQASLGSTTRTLR